MIDDKVEEGDSALTSASNMSMSSSVPKTRRKGPKAKKGKPSKRAATTSAESDEAAFTSSFVEPEDDTFNIKIDAVAHKSTRGRKRKTAEMEVNDMGDDSISEQVPSVKRRGTRTRSSTVKPATAMDLSQEEGIHADVSIIDAEAIYPIMLPTSKKKGKGGKKRASSTIRKASATSVASTASLRVPILDNDEIDAALEAALERPLIDDENNDEIPIVEDPQPRRLTRTQSNTRKASASVAPVRKGKGSRKAPLAEKEALQESIPSIEAPKEKSDIDNQSLHSQLIERVENTIETDINGESMLPDAESSILNVTRSKPSLVELPPPEPEESPSVLHGQQQVSHNQKERGETQPKQTTAEDFPTIVEKAVGPSLTPSPQSSDAENYPPSSRPSQNRPPLMQLSPSKTQTIRIPLTVSTPTTSPSKRMAALKLQSTCPWTSVDLENVFQGSPQPRKQDAVRESLNTTLSTPEKKMTVEEWIYHNARQGEERLRNECERLVGILENQGVQAMMSLEGIKCAE